MISSKFKTRYKCVLLNVTLLVSCCIIHSDYYGQGPTWESGGHLGIYYSPINGDELNKIMTENGYPEFVWSEIGFSYSLFTKVEGNWMLLGGLDLTGKLSNRDSVSIRTGNLQVNLSGGYFISQGNKFEIAPYAGVKGFFNGFWMNRPKEDNSFSTYLQNPEDINFFSTQVGLTIGGLLLYKPFRADGPGFSLQIEYMPIRWKPNFHRLGYGLEEIDGINSFLMVRLGIFLNNKMNE